MDTINETKIADYIMREFAGVETTADMGYKFFFYRGERMMPFATIALNGNQYETISQLDRPGVFRLNLGVGKAAFLRLFDARPAAPGKSGVIGGEYDFTVLDRIMPHPHYGHLYWVCVLNPSVETFTETVQPLLAEAYALDVSKHEKRGSRD